MPDNPIIDQKPKSRILAQAVGRRKAAVASVRLFSGNGDILVNGKPASVIFSGISAKVKYERPFSILQTNKYDASIKTHGGGTAGQLDAAILGLSRALASLKKDNRAILSTSGLLTRDPRERQRRMIGTGGKARRRKQSPKR